MFNGPSITINSPLRPKTGLIRLKLSACSISDSPASDLQTLEIDGANGNITRNRTYPDDFIGIA